MLSARRRPQHFQLSHLTQSDASPRRAGSSSSKQTLNRLLTLKINVAHLLEVRQE